jgi:fatty aldehyde-generating acyl-ACP reductase
LPNIAHGCLLESIVLSLADCASSYSRGRGNITDESMRDILLKAQMHGIVPAPLFNNVGAWSYLHEKEENYA